MRALIAGALLLATLAPALAERRAMITWPAIKGWRSSEHESYDRKTIWQAINGAAESYIAYGFVRMFHAEYRRKGIHAVVQVYDQGKPINAFGVLRRERPKGISPLRGIGSEALAAPPHQCLLTKGRFYVKVQANSGKLDAERCRQLLGPISSWLAGDNKPPAELSLLPKRHRIAGSVGYTRKSYLGLSELRDCLHAGYRVGKLQVQLFVVVGDARQLWKELLAKKRWKKVGALLARSVPYRGAVVVGRNKQGLFGISGAGDVVAASAALKKIGIAFR